MRSCLFQRRIRRQITYGRGVSEIPVWSVSLGCPKNRVDTEHLLGSFGRTVRPVAEIGHAKVVLINTCGFISSAVQESVQKIVECIHTIRSLRRKPLLVVAGCLVGRYGIEALREDLPEVDLFLPTETMATWGETVARALGLHEKKGGRLLSTDPSYAWLKISEGCMHNCSFCTIPSIRGPLTSCDKDLIVREGRTLLAEGVRELVLVAQDVTAYGKDTGLSLPALLDELISLPHLLWLRLLYLYPAGLTEELLRYIRDTGRPLLPYLDIPLQHSHPAILQSMGRPFAHDPRKLLERVHEILPDAVIRTTFIVGYPGETEAHFQDLCRFVEENRFMHVGVFAYEREEGTKAYSLPDQVPDDVRRARRATLMELQQEISRELLEKFVGQTEQVLVDSVNPEWPGLYNGRVWFQAPEVDGETYISGSSVKAGSVVSAEIVDSSAYDLSALA